MSIKQIIKYILMVLTTHPTPHQIKQLIIDIIDCESGIYEE